MPGRKIVPLRRIGQIVLSGITVDTIDPAYYTVAHGNGQRTGPKLSSMRVVVTAGDDNQLRRPV
jgi:hypothetical protein